MKLVHSISHDTRRIREARTGAAITVRTTVLTTTTPRAELLASRLVELQAQAKAIEEKKNEIQTKLVKELQANGVTDDEGKTRMENETHTLVIIKGENKTIDPKALLALGVKPTTIQKATRITPRTPYVGIYEKGKAKQGHGEAKKRSAR